MRKNQASSALAVDTLLHRLHRHALARPEQVAYTFLRYSEAASESLTYRDLALRAQVIGTHLRRKGAEGKPVLLLFDSGLEYITAYFGCLYAGAIAVPAYIPRSTRNLPRIQAIVADTQVDLVLTTTDELTKTRRWINKAPDLSRLTWIEIDSLNTYGAEPWQDGVIDARKLAFLQYTSGSTATPKGVMVSHGNLMHNLFLLHSYFEAEGVANPAGVYWLPIFHDMGLIMGVLLPLYGGYPGYLMSPTDFLQRPLRWLQAISDYRGTFSCAPNFAYELCLNRVSEQDLLNLDLSCWEGTACASEPVHSDTIERFTRYFAACGFPQTSLRAAYGLAEATLVVTSEYRTKPQYRVKIVSRQRLEENYVEVASTSEQAVKDLVGCGVPGNNQNVVIVDPETLQRCEGSRVGEIWVSGPSVALGYWQRPEETARIFQAYLATGEGPFLRTGDLGVFLDENLFITGRIKDLIIMNGRNLYPQDIEFSVERAHPAIRAGCSVAFSIEQENEERLIILAEIDHHYRPQADASDPTGFSQLKMQEDIVKNVRRAIAEQHAVRAHAVLLLKIGGILKTSSGKLQRGACRKAFLQDELKTW